MEDILIFGFGMVVTIVVGSGLASYVFSKNRDLEKEARAIPGEQSET